MARTPKGPKHVEALTHEEARRRNIPTAELQSTAEYMEELAPTPPVAYPRARPLAEGQTRERDSDLDPQIVWNGVSISLTHAQIDQLTRTGRVEIGDAQLVWRGKDRQDWSDLVVTAPPLYIQEKVHPKAIIDDLTRRSAAAREASSDAPDLFADFNGIDDPQARTEFYQHDQHWSNRMILGDSLQVMASLAEREALRGQVQCIYFDPPYGIKFNSNWQVSTQSTRVEDGKPRDLSREPEQVKAFRDTWRDQIHSYLTYLRDRLTMARDLLSDTGSIFVQIGDENVHRVRAVMDEVFGPKNFISEITFQKTGGQTSEFLPAIQDYVLWYGKHSDQLKFRRLYYRKEPGVGQASAQSPFPPGAAWRDRVGRRGIRAGRNLSEQRRIRAGPARTRRLEPDRRPQRPLHARDARSDFEVADPIGGRMTLAANGATAGLLADPIAVRARLRAGGPFYVYVLHRPDGQPFYVGKGIGDRCLHHEAEARTTRRLTHKLNVIRAIHRRGFAVGYLLESFHDTEADAHARERELIGLIGRHDLKRGPLTNQTDGGEGTSNPSEESRQRRRETLWGEDAEDPERQIANRYFQSLCAVRSVTLKAAATFRAEPLWANRDAFGMTARQAATLAASAIQNRVMLEPGARIPRRLSVDGVELIIENGVGRDILSSRMAVLADQTPGREVFELTVVGWEYLLATLDAELLIDAGVLAPDGA